MKLIKAYIRTFMAHKVLDEIRALKAPRTTVIDVKALGDEVDEQQLDISAELGSTYTTMVKIELICNDDCVERVKSAILEHARTGRKGDGVIAISPIEEAVKIKSGEKLGGCG